MLSSVDDIEARDWKCLGDGVARNLSIVLPKWNSLGRSTGLGCGKRNCTKGRGKGNVRCVAMVLFEIRQKSSAR